LRIDNEWLIAHVQQDRSIKAMQAATSSLVSQYDRLLATIMADKRNYMKESVSSTKDKIMTSKVKGFAELMPSSGVADGEEFNIEANDILIEAEMFLDIENAAWTIKKIKEQMSDKFVARELILMSPVLSSYLRASNIVSVDALSLRSDVLAVGTTEHISPFSRVDHTDLSNPNAIVNKQAFERAFYTANTKEPYASVNFQNSIKNIELSNSKLPYIEQNISDGELKGSGSKLSEYIQLSEGKSGSPQVDNIFILFGQEKEYTITIDETDYTYTAGADENPEDIAGELQAVLEENADLNIDVDTGYWSLVFENDDGDKPLGWYAESTDDSLAFGVRMALRDEGGDLEIEVDPDNEDGVLITFENDGSDTVYPFMEDLVNLVNGFSDSKIRVKLMPDYDVEDEYATVDTFDLEILASKISIEVQSDSAVDLPDSFSMMQEHISDYSESSSQSGKIEVIAFNKDDNYSITIGDVEYIVDMEDDENASVEDEESLAARFIELTQDDTLADVTRVVATIMVEAKNGGDSFAVVSSGEHNYVVPVIRETLLKYDIRQSLLIGSGKITGLQKAEGKVRYLNTPLSKGDVDGLLDAGYLYSSENLLLPQIDKTLAQEENEVPSVQRVGASIEKITRAKTGAITSAAKKIEQISKSMPVLVDPYYATSQAKSNRWFFVEAGGNSVAAKTSLEIALHTIAPSDFERLVYQDDAASFSTAIKNRLPNVGQDFESLHSLMTEKVPSYNASGLHSRMPSFQDIFKGSLIENLNSSLGEKVMYGFITYALLPQIDSLVDFILLMKLGIQMDDELKEQRFIALAGAYVADASSLEEFFCDPYFSDFMFGINEEEEAPENNYGLGGIPIDGTVTMAKLYFRNMRTQAMPIEDKKPVTMFSESLSILSIMPTFYIGSIQGASSKSTLSIKEKPIYQGSVPADLSLETEMTLGMGQLENYSTINEDFLLEELIRTGNSSTRIEAAINRFQTGFSKEYQTSIFSEMMNYIEIKPDGNIVSISQGKMSLQMAYQSFVEESITPYVFVSMLASYETSLSQPKHANSYSAYSTLSIKVALFLKESATPFSDWEEKYQSLIGLIFMDDDLAENILPFQAFLIWLSNCGMANMFSFAEDIQSSAQTVLNALDFSELGNIFLLDGKDTAVDASASLVQGKLVMVYNISEIGA